MVPAFFLVITAITYHGDVSQIKIPEKTLSGCQLAARQFHPLAHSVRVDVVSEICTKTGY